MVEQACCVGGSWDTYCGGELGPGPFGLVPAHSFDPPGFVVLDLRVCEDVVFDALDDICRICCVG
jgi:hypothetical protein